MIFGVTARGRTAQGCIEVLKNLPVTEIKPSEIEGIMNDKDNPAHQ